MVGLGSCLDDESLVNVGDNTTTSDGRFDKSVELFVTADSQLQVARGDAFDLEVFAGVTSELKNLSSEVLKNSSWVDCCSGANTAAGIDSSLENSVNSTNGELLRKISKY